MWLLCFSFSERTSCIIIAGGLRDHYKMSSVLSGVEVLTEDVRIKQLQNLPFRNHESTMVLHNGSILYCGGSHNEKKCLQFDQGTWKEHSILNEKRRHHSAVTTQTATFIFGGVHSLDTYEYLPKGSTTWLMGKTKMPSGHGLILGCAVFVRSKQEIWLIGSPKDEGTRIIAFDVNNHTFRFLPSVLNVRRIAGPKCAFIPGTKKIMITGGVDSFQDRSSLESTEILDTQDGSVTMASPMISKRHHH